MYRIGRILGKLYTILLKLDLESIITGLVRIGLPSSYKSNVSCSTHHMTAKASNNLRPLPPSLFILKIFTCVDGEYLMAYRWPFRK